jgi:hypothetical protein
MNTGEVGYRAENLALLFMWIADENKDNLLERNELKDLLHGLTLTNRTTI